MPTSSTPGTTTSAAPTATAPALGIDFRIPPTRAASPAASPAASLTSITVADDGRDITLSVGQRLLVNLGEEFDWTVQVAAQSILSRLPDVTVVRGAQGVYQANRVGRTALSATGDPPCRKAQPACAQPSRIVRVQIIVE